MEENSERLNKARIVVADDDTENLNMVEQALKHDGYVVRTCDNGEDAFHLIKSWSPQAVLLDVNMPRLSGLECLKKIRSLSSDYIGVILVTANSLLEEVVSGLDDGADDYIVKPYRLEELRARVRACLRVKHLHDSLRRSNKRLEEISSRDDLTNWYNMRYINKRLGQEIDSARKAKNPLSLVMFDMDHFKSVNDSNDHLFGSFVLCEVAKVVQGVLRASDIPGRYGGDEFIVALPNTGVDQAFDLAEKMRRAIETYTFKSEKNMTKLTASFGVCGVENNHDYDLLDVRGLIRAADLALYESKNSGRNRSAKKSLVSHFA